MLKTKNEIKNWLIQYGVDDYNILDDLTVDVAGPVFLNYRFLTEIPVQFGVVQGGFFCAENKLTSLKGSPHTVQGAFHCENNNLANLKYAPKVVNDDFNCIGNPIKNMKGFNTQIDGLFSHAYRVGKEFKIKELNDLYKQMDDQFKLGFSIPGRELATILSYDELKKEIVGQSSLSTEKNKFKL
jgi:hypothetical protein